MFSPSYILEKKMPYFTVINVPFISKCCNFERVAFYYIIPCIAFITHMSICLTLQIHYTQIYRVSFLHIYIILGTYYIHVN